MASRKKQLEGIALLSMYNDEEEDDEMEDADGREEERREPPRGDDYGEPRSAEDAPMADGDRIVTGDSGNEENTPRDVVDEENSAPGKGQFRPSTPLQNQALFASPFQQQQPLDSDNARSRRRKLAIVDYGHDEIAMSPEPEVIFVFFLLAANVCSFYL